jgi:hypothetical protein
MFVASGVTTSIPEILLMNPVNFSMLQGSGHELCHVSVVMRGSDPEAKFLVPD